MASTPKKGDAKGADGKYFQTTKKGEIAEFKADLNSTTKDKVKEAVKKVIAAMTVGKDVSSLFTDVVKSMQTNDLELKKLIYLYIINYARSQPDKAILIVNTFQKDARDASPLVRALAIPPWAASVSIALLSICASLSVPRSRIRIPMCARPRPYAPPSSTILTPSSSRNRISWSASAI